MATDHGHEHEHEHEHPPGHMHLEDPDANVAAIVADLEYFRRKRLESRLLFMARRGFLPLPRLLRRPSALGGRRCRRWRRTSTTGSRRCKSA